MPTAHIIGDSNATGQGLGSSANRWASLLCASKGWTEDNQGVGASAIYEDTTASGGNANSMYVKAFGITVANGDVSCVLPGLNDMRLHGSDANYLSENGDALRHTLALLLIPTASRVLHDNVAIAYAGTWGTSGFGGGVHFSSTAGATASFTVSGTSIVIGTARGTSGGNLSVTVDGASVNMNGGGTTYSCLSAIMTVTGLIVITGLSAGSHNVVVTAATSANTYLLWYYGVVTAPTTRVYCGGPFRLPAATYAMYTPYNAGSDAAADAYKEVARASVAIVRSAGLNCVYANVGVTPADDFQVDGIHLDESGHAQVAAEFGRAGRGGGVAGGAIRHGGHVRHLPHIFRR